MERSQYLSHVLGMACLGGDRGNLTGSGDARQPPIALSANIKKV